MIEPVCFAVGVALLAIFGLYMLGRQKGLGGSSPFALPSGVTLTSVPILNDGDVVLYNVMRLAVQDQYLIFAQVPLWSFVSVEGMGQARAQVLNQIALKRVDFVLVHPGTRQVEQVIQLEDALRRPHQTERQRVIEAVLAAAGITLVTLQPQTSYAVPELQALLGLSAED